MAVVSHSFDGLVMFLILIAPSAGNGKFLRKHIEADEFDILISCLCKSGANLVHKPQIGLDAVLRL